MADVVQQRCKDRRRPLRVQANAGERNPEALPKRMNSNNRR